VVRHADAGEGAETHGLELDVKPHRPHNAAHEGLRPVTGDESFRAERDADVLAGAHTEVHAESRERRGLVRLLVLDEDAVDAAAGTAVDLEEKLILEKVSVAGERDSAVKLDRVGHRDVAVASPDEEPAGFRRSTRLLHRRRIHRHLRHRLLPARVLEDNVRPAPLDVEGGQELTGPGARDLDGLVLVAHALDADLLGPRRRAGERGEGRHDRCEERDNGRETHVSTPAWGYPTVPHSRVLANPSARRCTVGMNTHEYILIYTHAIIPTVHTEKDDIGVLEC